MMRVLHVDKVFQTVWLLLLRFAHLITEVNEKCRSSNKAHAQQPKEKRVDSCKTLNGQFDNGGIWIVDKLHEGFKRLGGHLIIIEI